MRKKQKTQAEVIHFAAQQVFEQYVDHCLASITGSLAHDLYGNAVVPDVIFLEQIEDEIPVSSAIDAFGSIADSATDDFRRSVAAFVGGLVQKGIQPSWTSNTTLKTAIIKYLAKHQPEALDNPIDEPKYRRISDPWEPAW